MVAVEQRLKRLEGGGPTPPCDYCGGGGDDDDNWDEPYVIFFEDEEPEDLEENCPQCGRALVYTIYFDDDVRAPWNQARLPWSARGRPR
jgi:hypothetical protein